MPCFARFIGKGMPEEPEYMAAVILRAVCPCIGQRRAGVALVERPDLLRRRVEEKPEISNSFGSNPSLFKQFSDSCRLGGLPWLQAAFDQLQASQWMLEGKNLQPSALAQNHRAGPAHLYAAHRPTSYSIG